VVELYNDSNEVSVLINSSKRKLTSPPLLPRPSSIGFNGRVSHEQSRKFQRDGCFKIAGKTDLSSGVAKPGLASNYNVVPSRCRRFLDTTEIRQVNCYVLRTSFLPLPLLVPLPWHQFNFLGGSGLRYEWLVNLSMYLFSCRIDNIVRNHNLNYSLRHWFLFCVFHGSIRYSIVKL